MFIKIIYLARPNEFSMRASRYLFIVFATMLVGGLLVPATVQASSIQMNVPSNGYIGLNVSMNETSYLTYSAKVISGGPVSFLLMTDPEFKDFRAGDPYSYISSGSAINVTEIDIGTDIGPGYYHLLVLGDRSVTMSSNFSPVWNETNISFSIVSSKVSAGTLNIGLIIGMITTLCLVLLFMAEVIARRQY